MGKFIAMIMMLGMLMLLTALTLFVIWLNYLVLFSALGLSQAASIIIVGAMAITLGVGSAAICFNKD